MKNKIALLLLLIAPAICHAITPDEIEQLLPALQVVESNNQVDAIGDGGRAAGILQIHPIMVKECNRILGREWFTLADRFSVSRSRAMARVYFGHYGKGWTLEQAARAWNGGPKGYTKKATLKYWGKVKRELDVIQ